MATSIRSEWTEAKCLRLIREYRARPILWDKKEPYFYKKTMKPKAWREIGNIVNISPDKCKHKMGVLMSSFRREKAKIVHKMRDEPGSMVHNSIWFGFKEMSFLMDKETERKRQSLGIESIDEEEDDEDDSQESPIQLLKHIETHVPPRTQNKVIKRTSIKRKLSVLSTQSIQEEEAHASPAPVPVPVPALGPSQTASERNEEISSFTSFIGIKMKKYSDTTKNAVQQAICEIIFKADQNYYENGSSYEKLTVIDDHSDPLDKAIYEAQNGIIKVQSYSDSD